MNVINESKIETATFGAGCFWGVEEVFRQLPGVQTTAVGFMGGAFENPTYEDVCSGATGHAEVVQILYDPAIISYEALLDVFWKNHNPTTLNRQGPDVGTQYRSVIFFYSTEQQVLAQRSLESLVASGTFSRPIVTQVVPAGIFFKAEEYHQQYLKKRGLGSCHL
ncbi:MAG: peptide-methionine (S)-S-oxide reductase MsrA [bacterium]